MQERSDVHKVFAEYFDGVEALAYAVSERLGQGSICLDLEHYLTEGDLVESNPFFRSAEDFKVQISNEKYITDQEDVLKPFVIRNGKAYLHRYFQYETQIIENIEKLGVRLKIITGGPGTGKTYSVSTALVELFRDDPGLKVALAAPTGKAAARMNEAIRDFVKEQGANIPEEIRPLMTGLKASTIHMLLGRIPDNVFFRYNEHRKLPYDVLIVDECSMIAGAMMAKLLNAIDEHTRVFLLGDRNQLASVEAGSVFGDICRMEDSALLEGRVDTLTKSRRFKEGEGIWELSKEVINGKLTLPNYEEDEQVIIDLKYNTGLAKKYAMRYLDYIREEDTARALHMLNRIRFLCVTREHDHSVADLNKQIERWLTAEVADPDLFKHRKGFYHNQPIIITKNDYNLKIYNGDVALIRKVGDKLFAFFEAPEGDVREIQAGYLNHYETVFAMTIHKSQGSQFEEVVVLLPEKRGRSLLTRELLYTGITRAEKKVLVQGNEEVIQLCVENTGVAVIRNHATDKIKWPWKRDMHPTVLEYLAGKLAKSIKEAKGSVFGKTLLVTQSAGMNAWLKNKLAIENRVFANFEFLNQEKLFAGVYRALFGEYPSNNQDRVKYRIYELLAED